MPDMERTRPWPIFLAVQVLDWKGLKMTNEIQVVKSSDNSVLAILGITILAVAAAVIAESSH